MIRLARWLLIAILIVSVPARAQPGPDAGPPDAGPPPAEPALPDPPVETPPSEVTAEAPPSTTTLVMDEEEPWEPAPGLVDYVSVSTKVTEPAIRTPASVAVVTAEQIARGGYRSVAEALADIPGLYVSYDLDNYNVAVRGLYGGARAGSRYLKVMIDGRAVSFVQADVHYLGPEFIPISAVERIEVMRGPVSSLYGAGALVGAINIVTRRPAYEGETTTVSSITLRGSVLGIDGGGGEGVQTVVSRRMFLLLAASVARDDRSGLTLPTTSPVYEQFMSDAGGPIASEDDTARPAALVGRLEYIVGGGRFSALGLGQFHDAAVEFHDLAALTHGTRVAVYNAGGSAWFERSFPSGLGVLASASVWRGGPRGSERFDLPDEIFTLRRRFGYTQTEGSFELRYDGRNGGWLLAGVDGRYDREQMQQYLEVRRTDGVITPRPDPGTRTLANAAAYVQALLPVGKRWRFATGARWDQHTIYGGALSARAAVVATPHPRVSIKLLGGRSYKAPSPEQLFGVPMDNRDVAGNDRIGPQYLNGGEAVVATYPARWLAAEISGYYQWYDGALAYIRKGADLAPEAFDAESWGGEASLRASVEREAVTFDGAASATYQRLHVVERFIDGRIDKPIPDNEGTPVWMAAARAAVRLTRPGVVAHARFRHVGRRTPSQSNLVLDGTAELRSPTYSLDSYQLVDLSLSRGPIKLGDGGAVSLQASVHNALDKRYADIGFNGVDVPGLGRTIWLVAHVEL